MKASTTSVELKILISADLQEKIKWAAELQGCSVNDFMVAALQDTVTRTIERDDVIRLKPADQECFARVLLAPPQPEPALERALLQRRNLLDLE